MYEKKFGIPHQKIASLLWGDNFLDEKNKKWLKEASESAPRRAWDVFVYDPIKRMINAFITGNKATYEKIIAALKITLTETDRLKPDRELAVIAMKRFLPVTDAIFQMVIHNLPSPSVAQRYRAPILYDAPDDDECFIGIKNCDPSGPLMIHF
jgi:elongation factor 2